MARASKVIIFYLPKDKKTISSLDMEFFIVNNAVVVILFIHLSISSEKINHEDFVKEVNSERLFRYFILIK